MIASVTTRLDPHFCCNGSGSKIGSCCICGNVTIAVGAAVAKGMMLVMKLLHAVHINFVINCRSCSCMVYSGHENCIRK